MRHLMFEYFSCEDLIKAYGKKKLVTRFDTLYEEMNLFIEQNDLQGKVSVNKNLLSTAIVDYFNDILRIKEFHKNIKKVNSEKVVAYTSYWLLQRKPFQVSDVDAFLDRKLATINERFVLQYICNYLCERERKSHLFVRPEVGLQNFNKFLLYYLIYRLHDAQSLELMIVSFMAGQIYENIDVDVSDEMHIFDNMKAEKYIDNE